MEILLSLLAMIFYIPVKIFLKTVIKSLFSWVDESLYHILGHEIASALGNMMVGVILGGASLLVVPQHITPNMQIRLVNLLVTPLLIGALVNFSSNIKFQKHLFGFDRTNFIAGYFFALAMASIRFLFAK